MLILFEDPTSYPFRGNLEDESRSFIYLSKSIEVPLFVEEENRESR